MQNSTATIIAANSETVKVAACAARISTQPGSALELFGMDTPVEKNQRLINRVMASGHQSIAEHQVFSIAFDNVSVFVEQFVIEFRLASFTVKSRRYVDFSHMGFVMPELSDSVKSIYSRQMATQFERYEKLVSLGIPREDARFVFPYALRSNFYVTVNARELMQMILQMTRGRGKGFAELERLGNSLADQFERFFPGVLDLAGGKKRPVRIPARDTMIGSGGAVTPEVSLISAPVDGQAFLNDILDGTRRFDGLGDDERLCALVLDDRPREMELLNYVFRIRNLSLACLTHITRHRMQTLLVENVATVLGKADYVLPPSVAAQPDAVTIYREAFASQSDAAWACLDAGMPAQYLVYFAMSGHVTDVIIGQNARELMHFIALRTCRRAQWEIQGIASGMLALLRDDNPALFGKLGPGCAMTGKCPEGKMTCGQPFPRTMPEKVDSDR